MYFPFKDNIQGAIRIDKTVHTHKLLPHQWGPSLCICGVFHAPVVPYCIHFTIWFQTWKQLIINLWPTEQQSTYSLGSGSDINGFGNSGENKLSKTQGIFVRNFPPCSCWIMKIFGKRQQNHFWFHRRVQNMAQFARQELLFWPTSVTQCIIIHTLQYFWHT